MSKHEIKIEDLEDSIKNETNNAAKKNLMKDLQKMQKDETYLTAVTDIKEAQAQAARDAERAAITAKAGDKKGAKESGKVEEEKPTAKSEKADAGIVAEIDAAFAVSGKDAVAAKEKALARMQGCAMSTPFMLPKLDMLIPLFDNSKLAAPASKAAKAILENTQPKGHGIAAIAVPILLAGMNDKKWKVIFLLCFVDVGFMDSDYICRLMTETRMCMMFR